MTSALNIPGEVINGQSDSWQINQTWQPGQLFFFHLREICKFESCSTVKLGNAGHPGLIPDSRNYFWKCIFMLCVYQQIQIFFVKNIADLFK